VRQKKRRGGRAAAALGAGGGGVGSSGVGGNPEGGGGGGGLIPGAAGGGSGNGEDAGGGGASGGGGGNSSASHGGGGGGGVGGGNANGLHGGSGGFGAGGGGIDRAAAGGQGGYGGGGGSGTVGGSAGAGGLIIDGAGTVDLGAPNTFTGGITIDSGTLVLNNAQAAGSGTITFGSGDPPVLAFTTDDAPANTIGGFAPGDTIDVTDITGTAATATLGAGGVLAIVYDGGILDLTFAGVSPGQVFDLTSDDASGTDIAIACYARGTLILTDRGEAPIEDLRIGDALVTHSGAVRPLRWVGRRSYGGAFIAGNRRVLPIRISAGALADGVPKRDLFVSPEHALFLDGMLVPAVALLNGRGIVQLDQVDRIEYFHLEMDSHDRHPSCRRPSARHAIAPRASTMAWNWNRSATAWPTAPAPPCGTALPPFAAVWTWRRTPASAAGPGTPPTRPRS
jgi:hypothetical protein